MRLRDALKWTAALAAGGTAFAGYLSFYKLLRKTCAFDEPCPNFLGYPACWYGLAMFAAILAVALAGLAGKLPEKKAAKAAQAVSAAGIVFAGYFTWTEIMSWFAGHAPRYALGLPSCAYGLLFYFLICAFSRRALRAAPPV